MTCCRIMMLMLVALLVSSFVHFVTSVDLTLESEASGTDVVHACVAKISLAHSLLSYDEKLLRRIAYAETRDGLNTDTYSGSDNNGGIWQLSSAKYEQTKTVLSETLLQSVSIEFGIDWSSTVWSDLRKPFYSALAARLYMEVVRSTNNVPIPFSISNNEQANYWVTQYTSSSEATSSQFETIVQQLNTNEVCKVDSLDLIFIMDASSSVGDDNFQKLKSFVYNITNRFDIGSDRVRIGAMSYSNDVTFHFHLKDHLTKSSVLSAIDSITYESSRFTRTSSALDAVRTTMFTELNGARPGSQGVPRVAFLVTDGKAESKAATKTAAEAMHSAGIIGIPIGLAEARSDELEAIATRPSHITYIDMFELPVFSAIYINMSQAICIASPDLSIKDNITDTIRAGEIKYLNFPLPVDNSGITIKLHVTVGSCTLYASSIVQTPNDALYDLRFSAITGWRDAYIDPNQLSNFGSAERIYIVVINVASITSTIRLIVDIGDTSTVAVSTEISPASSLIGFIGSKVSATCYATGRPLPTFNWFRPDGTLITSSSGDITMVENSVNSTTVSKKITISSLSASHVGVYRCTATNTLPFGNPLTSISTLNLTVRQFMAVDFVGVAISSTVIRLSWDIPVVPGVNIVIQYYRIDVEEVETGRTWNIIVNTKTTQIGSLHAYYFYHFKLTAVGNGTYPTDTIVKVRTFQAAPSLPPGDLSSNSITQTSLNLTWNPPPISGQNGIIGYYIIKMTEVQTNTPFEFTSNFTYIHLTKLRSYFSYTFRVAAVTISAGPYSGEYTVQLPEDVPGASPSNFTAVVTFISITSITVTFTWTSPPVHQINGVLLGYTFTYRTIGSQVQTINTQTQTTITISTMEIRTHYTCTVCASTSQGCGPTAIIYLFTIQPGTIVTSTTATTIKIEWNSPFKDYRIRYYQINYQIIQSSFNIQTPRPVQIINTGSREVEYTIEFLLSSTTYRIEVIAVFIDATYKAIGSAVTARTKDRDDYSITNYRCLSESSSRLYCTWTPALPPVGYIILRYELAYRLVDGFDYLPGYGTELSRTNLTRTVTDFHIIGLRIYAGYVVELKCVMTSAVSTVVSISSVVNFTESALVIGTVDNTRVQVNISTLFWRPPPRIDWNGVILHYLIHYERQAVIDTQDVVRRNITYLPTANNGDPSLALEPLKYERYVFEKFEAHFVYRLSITIVNTKGPGTSSNIIIVTVPESVPTGPPTDIIALSITSFSITIGWKPPDPVDANGVITRYSLIITRISLQYTQTIELASNVLFYKQEGLYSYENISVSLAARTAIGWGPYSKLHFFTTLEDLPGCPVNLKGEIINGDVVVLTWRHPSNSKGLIIDYRVVYTGYDFSRTIIIDATTVEIFQSTSGSQSMRVEIRNLFYGYLYEFKVQGRNRAGLGDNSTVTVYISSDTIVPSVPLNLQGEFITNSSVRLMWTTPSVINGVILDYQVIYIGYELPQSDDVLVGPVVLVTTRTEIVITELLRGYYYEFRVRARNEAGFGMNSSLVMLAPPQDPTAGGLGPGQRDDDVGTWIVIILLALLCAILLCILCILCLICCTRAYRRRKKTCMYRCPSAKGSLDGTCDGAGKTVTLDSAEFYGRNSRTCTMERKTIVLNSNDQHCSEGQEPTCICEDKDPAICFDFTDSNIHLHTHDDNVPEKDCPIEVIGKSCIHQLPSIPSDNCPCDNDSRRGILVHTDSIVKERDLHVNTMDDFYPRTNELHIVTDTLESSSPVKVTIPLGASPEPPVHIMTTIGDDMNERVPDKSVEVVLQPPTPLNVSRDPSPYDSLKTRSLPRNPGQLKVSRENVAFGGPRTSSTIPYRNKSNTRSTISRSSENIALPETVVSNASGRTFENNISDIRKPPMYSVTRIRSSENLRNKPFSTAQSPSKSATLQRHRTFSSPSSARKVTVREGYELKSLTISNIGGKLELQPAHMRGQSMRGSPLRRSFSRDDLSTTL